MYMSGFLIALQKAVVPFPPPPPEPPVRSRNMKQTGGRRLHLRHRSDDDGCPKADIVRRTTIDRVWNFAVILGPPSKERLTVEHRKFSKTARGCGERKGRAGYGKVE